jgi:hypothetical protein
VLHEVGQLTPVEHRYGEHDGLAPGFPLPTAAQAPVEQLSHPPAQALLQQRPSTQNVVAHWVPAVQVWPFFDLHAPAESQVLFPVQVSPSSMPVTDVHVPGVPPQVWQAALHADAQQNPSTQLLLAHTRQFAS